MKEPEVFNRDQENYIPCMKAVKEYMMVCQDPYFHIVINGSQHNIFSDAALQFGFGSQTKASS
jgi:hypothetical protein